MSPWSRAEADESIERALFERRARALAPAAALPALADVMREADARVERAGARKRVVMGLALAAACFAATVTALPRVASGPRDARGEPDAGLASSFGASFAGQSVASCTEDQEASTCGDAPSSPFALASIDVPACMAPEGVVAASAYEPPGVLWCEPEPSRSVAGN